MQDIVALVTGANTGIGRAAVEELAKRGANVILANRSFEKTQPVMELIRAAGARCQFESLDLADLGSVRACAERVLLKYSALNLLINNAGVAGARGTTKQGFELTFGTNHLGHFLLTELLRPVLRKTSGARIINVASSVHRRARGIPFGQLRLPTQSRTGLPEYAVSKLCNVLHARALAKREPGIICCALHPGSVASDVWREVPQPVRWLIKLGMLTNAEGAKTTLHCATTANVHSGAYYDDCRAATPSKLALDDALGEELWRRSEEWCVADAAG
jgi:retinol dehydrogenase 12